MDSHFSADRVPLACVGYEALEHDSSSGCKPPLQDLPKWHRLWEEDMGVPSPLRSPDTRGRDTFSEMAAPS